MVQSWSSARAPLKTLLHFMVDAVNLQMYCTVPLACMISQAHTLHITHSDLHGRHSRTQAFGKTYERKGNAHTYTRTSTHACTLRQTYINTRTHAHTHTHTHTHTYGSSGAMYGSVGRSCSPLVNPINTAMILFICGNSFKHVDFNVCT